MSKVNTVLDLRMRNLVLQKYSSGDSYRKISSELNISLGVICKIVKQYKVCGDVANHLSNCGRRKRLSIREQRILLLEVRKNPSATSKSLSLILQQHGAHIAPSTVRLYLKRAQLGSHFAPNKPLLTARHRKLRLAFAKKYVKEAPEFWRRVIFTDETKISIRNACTRIRVWRKPGERLKFVNPTSKFPTGVMLWGSFTAAGYGRIRFLDSKETCNSAWYLKVLENEVKSHAAELFDDGQVWYLQDDGAPCHRSKVVKRWIAEHGWTVFNWPPQSPDLNPIENCWAQLKWEVSKKVCNTILDLKLNILKAWKYAIPQDYYENLAMSMPSRLRECIKNKGGVTKY